MKQFQGVSLTDVCFAETILLRAIFDLKHYRNENSRQQLCQRTLYTYRIRTYKYNIQIYNNILYINAPVYCLASFDVIVNARMYPNKRKDCEVYTRIVWDLSCESEPSLTPYYTQVCGDEVVEVITGTITRTHIHNTNNNII